ncbi:MAG: hypothetical protein V1743_02735 [Nanoarchaeota archaeon]
MELDWADIMGLPIICIYKKGSKVAGSVKLLTETFLENMNE